MGAGASWAPEKGERREGGRRGGGRGRKVPLTSLLTVSLSLQRAQLPPARAGKNIFAKESDLSVMCLVWVNGVLSVCVCVCLQAGCNSHLWVPGTTFFGVCYCNVVFPNRL